MQRIHLFTTAAASVERQGAYRAPEESLVTPSQNAVAQPGVVDDPDFALPVSRVGPNSGEKALLQFLGWVSMLLTITLFLLIQIHIRQDISGMLGEIMEIGSVVVEFLIILRISSSIG